jgi:signal transduction histidine kinase
MILEILEYSRIGRVTQEKAKLNLKEIVDDSISQFMNQIQNKCIQISYKGEFPPVFAEKNRITQLFGNLIGNSIKYMGNQTRPNIELGTLEDDSKFITVYVKDNGMGIPNSFRNKVFNIFSRAENVKSQNIDGSGIGLAHVKKILETHGGKIWFESEEGSGTTMYFTLPLAN